MQISTISLIQERYIDVFYHQEISTIELVWKDFAKSAEYRQVMGRIADFFEEYKAESLMVDLRKGEVVSIADQEWYFQEIIPRFTKAGLKKAGAIPSTNNFNKFYSDNGLSVLTQHNIDAHYFENRGELLMWILENQLS